MKNLTRSILLGLSIATGTLASAQDIKGVALGMDAGEAFAKINATQQCSEWVKQGRCIMIASGLPDSMTTLAGTSIDGFVITVDGGKVASITVMFNSENYHHIHDAYAAKYKAMRCAKEIVQNRMGASFDNEKCDWKDGGANWSLRQRTSNLLRGAIYLVSSDGMEAAERAQQQKQEAAQKDL